jgi:hypothetical protein
MSVCGVCFDPKFKVYILWALKLMKDMPSIFEATSVEFIDMSSGKDGQKEIERKNKQLKKFDIVVSDEERLLDVKGLKDTAIVAFMRSKPVLFYLNIFVDSDQTLSELELLARSGFLSLVNLSHFQEGKLKTEVSLP